MVRAWKNGESSDRSTAYRHSACYWCKLNKHLHIHRGYIRIMLMVFQIYVREKLEYLEKLGNLTERAQIEFVSIFIIGNNAFSDWNTHFAHLNSKMAIKNVKEYLKFCQENIEHTDARFSPKWKYEAILTSRTNIFTHKGICFFIQVSEIWQGWTGCLLNWGKLGEFTYTPEIRWNFSEVRE